MMVAVTRGVGSCLLNCRSAYWYSRGRVVKLRVERTYSYSLSESKSVLVTANCPTVNIFQAKIHQYIPIKRGYPIQGI